ncbi:MAG: hypothetical protein FWE72_02600 [Spirochaetaceae bacterium]|nr:hypothetical protein [Spirochaetaceae bacterium]
MKRILMLLFILSMFLVAGCQKSDNSGAPKHTEEAKSYVEKNMHTIESVEEIFALFEKYWNMGEDRETGNEIMHRFKKEPALILKALTVTTYREQILILIGSTIAEAKHNDNVAYAEYTKVLESITQLDLDKDSNRMLGFINANIEYWYNH